MNEASPDVTHTTFAVLILGGLIAGSLWTMLPFLGALIWATAIVVATWPALLWVQRLAGGRRSVATAVMVVIILVGFIIPFWVAVGALLDASTNAIDIAQIGPILVMVPAVIWLYGTGDVVLGTVLLIWSIPVCIMDNFLRPILISRGVDLPLLLIIAGVVGGLIGFGVIGLFVGPVILAVSYTLLQSWTRDEMRLREA